MEDNKILAQTKQSYGFDIFSVLFVLIIPISFIFFSNQIGGIFIGVAFLAFFLYGIIFLYNKLYRKKLIITKNKLIYKDKYFFKLNTKTIEFSAINDIKIEQTFINKILNIGKLTLKLKDEQEIFLINIDSPSEIKKIIESLKKR